MAQEHLPNEPERAEPSALAESPRETLQAAELDERQLRGIELHRAAERANGLMVLLNDSTTLWYSQTDSTRAYQVSREQRNRRGTPQIEYRCQCGDFVKNGRVDCLHIFAEKLRRGEVAIAGALRNRRKYAARSNRRPARKVKAADGRSGRSARRAARVKMFDEAHRLIDSLVRVTLIEEEREQAARPRRGGQQTPTVHRAAALLHKIVEGRSADDMISRYARLIRGGMLRLDRPPHQNTQSAWMNDAEITQTLMAWLPRTSAPFRRCERGGIVDSTKESQLASAHARFVEYGGDLRDGADWMKVHTLAGVETLVIMAARFSGSRGTGTHDINFVIPLVEEALKTFRLEFLLGDKAYLSENVLGWLWQRSIKAVIPVKMRWDPNTKMAYHEAAVQLVEWFDKRQRDFHEKYRLRAKIEALFSALKRVTNGFVWSRGRRRSDAANADSPCTAWVNETLCKLLYMNIRTTVSYQELTGCSIDYTVPSRCFPELGDDLLAA